MNKDQILLDAINQLDKSKVEKAKGKTNLYDFMLVHSQKMSAEALLFLRNNYNVSFKYIFSRIDVTKDQMRMLLQKGYKPTKHMIFTYSGFIDITLFNMLLDYGIKIPEEIVWHWESIVFAKALESYLEHGGNPNIRPFAINSRSIDKYGPSLIDKWIMQQEDTNRKKQDIEIINAIVNDLIKHGGKKSPYAMTFKERNAYFDLQQNDPKQFVLEVKQKITEIQEYMNNVQDEIEYEECILAIEKFETDITFCAL